MRSRTIAAAGVDRESPPANSIPFFFGLHLPALVDKDVELAGLIREIHQTGGTIGTSSLGLHAAAALFHHYVMRDTPCGGCSPNPDLSAQGTTFGWASDGDRFTEMTSPSGTGAVTGGSQQPRSVAGSPL